MSCVGDLVSYPQYVNQELGQEEYLEFVQKMFKKISENLPLNAETIMLVWWLRFERTLLVAGRQPLHRKKRLKSLAKDLLKEERHRCVHGLRSVLEDSCKIVPEMFRVSLTKLRMSTLISKNVRKAKNY